MTFGARPREFAPLSTTWIIQGFRIDSRYETSTLTAAEAAAAMAAVTGKMLSIEADISLHLPSNRLPRWHSAIPVQAEADLDEISFTGEYMSCCSEDEQ